MIALTDYSTYLIGIAAVAGALFLLWAISAILRRTSTGGVPWGRGTRRLSLVETLPLDAKHRAVLLRCDGQEHLILLGGEKDLLISSTPAAGTPPAAAGRIAPPSPADLPGADSQPAADKREPRL